MPVRANQSNPGVVNVTRARLTITLGTLILLSYLGTAVPAWSQDQRPAPRGFDYWQPDWMVRELWGPGRMPKSMMIRLLRHTTYVQYGVPTEYDGAQSTAAPGRDIITAGGRLYSQHCLSCHGTDGMGGGEAGRALTPSPALLAYMIRRPISVDEYLLWAIAEGGKQFDSEMPAFKDKLSREDIWRIVAYMRAGFPQPEPQPAPRQ
jgi:mono/diheme cytochrome c family protein